jgi:multiple sugar transport system ATP-binding protein
MLTKTGRADTLARKQNGRLVGKVRIVERLGGLTLLHVAWPDANGPGEQTVIVQIEGSDATRPHEAIRLAVDADSGHLFNEAGEVFPRTTRHTFTH